jgi:hypothetical protein
MEPFTGAVVAANAVLWKSSRTQMIKSDQELETTLDRIRHESKPTPPIKL